MPKYYCEHCNKKVNEKRKIHFKSEQHKKNKDSYYSAFPSLLSHGLTEWAYIESEEYKQYIKYLESFQQALYKKNDKLSS